jgi:hypothetical protein
MVKRIFFKKYVSIYSEPIWEGIIYLFLYYYIGVTLLILLNNMHIEKCRDAKLNLISCWYYAL